MWYVNSALILKIMKLHVFILFNDKSLYYYGQHVLLVLIVALTIPVHPDFEALLWSGIHITLMLVL